MRLRDTLAKSLWTGEVQETGGYSIGNLTGTVRKQQEGRQGQVPSHIVTPFEGRPRPYDPFTLRRLAETETVQAAISTIIADVMAIEDGVSSRDEDAPREDLVDEVEQALEDLNPNKESQSTVNEMWLRDLLEVGNAVAVKNFQIDGRRVDVMPLDPNTFTVDWDRNRVLQAFYQYDLHTSSYMGRPQRFEPDEIIWLTLDPETSRAGFYGHSPVERLQNVINVMGGLLEKERKELEEGMPPGILSLTGDWSDSDYKQFETYWKNNVRGEQHKVPLAKGEAEFQPFSMSYKDLQILDRQKWYAKLVGAIFKVPISENGLAIGEEMTRATDVSQRQKYKQKAIRPRLEDLQDAWNKQVIHPHFTEQVEYAFNPGLDLMEKKELANIHSTLLRHGVETPNEVRAELGKEPVEWGDEPFDLKSYARSNSGLDPGTGLPSGGFGGGGGDDDPPDDDPGTSEEGENQEALQEGMDQDLPEEKAAWSVRVPEQGTHYTEAVAAGRWSKPRLQDFDSLQDAQKVHLYSSSGFPPEKFGDLGWPVITPDGSLSLTALDSAWRTAGNAPEGAARQIRVAIRRLLNRHQVFEGSDLQERVQEHFAEKGGKDFRDSLSGSGSLLPQAHVHKADQPLRETENWGRFNFQPQEIERLRQDVADVFRDYMEAVQDRIVEERDKWTAPRQQGTEAEKAVSKSLPSFYQLIRNEIGIELAEDLAGVLTEHKMEKVLAGQDTIADELAAAGLDPDDIPILEESADRVASRIQRRTLKVTKPISDRMESQLRDVIEEGWMEGKSITDIERDIEDLTDQWQGTDAERLARDQLGKASKEGRMEYAKETEQAVGGWTKTWLTTGGHTGDGRTRTSHKYMHETTVAREEPFVVNYTPDGGPANVEEDYPGESYWGIQCRCDFELAPKETTQAAKSWGQDLTQRQEEVQKGLEGNLWERLLAMEMKVRRGDLSRNQAAKDLGVSKRTYYSWIEDAGLKE